MPATPGTEGPERAERIRAELAEAGARFVEARSQPDETLLAVHAVVDFAGARVSLL